jgi:hypothetical protein
MKRKISDKGSIYIQNAKSDMRVVSGKQNSIGYSHKINSSTKIFAHYSSLRKQDSNDNITFISTGLEYKF